MSIFTRRRSRPPVLFLDIDGVLLPFGHRQDDLTVVNLGGWQGRVLYSPSIVTRIRNLHEWGLVEVQWLTAWEEDAATCLAPVVGFGAYRVHIEPTGQPVDASVYWKERVVRDHAAKHPRFVWLDDEMTNYGSDVTVPRDLPDGLVIAPVSEIGLTHEHLDAVEAYLAS